MDCPAPEPETILVVEDDPQILDLVTHILKSEGYSVLSAGSGEEGLHIGTQYGRKIHMLLTDIVMPRISGGELASQLRLYRPHIQVLFMSGYTKYTKAAHGTLQSAEDFIWKPFSSSDLTLKVREMLAAGQTPE